MRFLPDSPTGRTTEDSPKHPGIIPILTLDPFIHKDSVLFVWERVIRYNPICKAFAARLAAEGKPSIVIVGAVMTKLLHIIYGVLKHGQPFNPNHLKKAEITP